MIQYPIALVLFGSSRAISLMYFLPWHGCEADYSVGGHFMGTPEVTTLLLCSYLDSTSLHTVPGVGYCVIGCKEARCVCYRISACLSISEKFTYEKL